MKILYLGENSSFSTSKHRAAALRRLGHEVDIINPLDLLPPLISGGLAMRLHARTGFRLVQKFLEEALSGRFPENGPADHRAYDLLWVNSGEAVGAGALRLLKGAATRSVLYNNDDPLGGRDGRRWDSLVEALPLYDLCAAVRDPTVEDFRRMGAKSVVRVWMSYDEYVHRPQENAETIAREFRSDVAFVGTWMEDRDVFLAELLARGLRVNIWGSRWQKSANFRLIRPAWRGEAILGREYVWSMQGAKLCLGLLSKGNRDEHTQRSMEIPYAGGVLCGERTPEHEALYADGEEAVFWRNAAECAERCRELLENAEARERIRRRGGERVRELKVGNEDVCRYILEALETATGGRGEEQRSPRKQALPPRRGVPETRERYIS